MSSSRLSKIAHCCDCFSDFCSKRWQNKPTTSTLKRWPSLKFSDKPVSNPFLLMCCYSCTCFQETVLQCLYRQLLAFSSSPFFTHLHSTPLLANHALFWLACLVCLTVLFVAYFLLLNWFCTTFQLTINSNFFCICFISVQFFFVATHYRNIWSHGTACQPGRETVSQTLYICKQWIIYYRVFL